MTSYLELVSACGYRPPPIMGTARPGTAFFSGGLLWGIRPQRGPGKRRGGGQRQSSDDAREGPRSHRGPSPLAALAEPAAGVEGEQELLPGAVDLEVVALLEEVLDGLHRARPEGLVDRVAVDVGVLHDQVAARGDQGGVGPQLGQDVVAGVVG